VAVRARGPRRAPILGATTVLILNRNEKDLPGNPKEVADSLEMIRVKHMDEVLPRALVLDEPDKLYEKLTEHTAGPM